MPDPTGAWLRPALELERFLATLAKPDRAAVLRREAGRRELALQTLRRMLPAARYVASRVKSVGLGLDDVKAAAVTIEALMRYDRRDPEAAAAIREDVFKGKISARVMLARLRDVGPQQPLHPKQEEGWIYTARGLSEILVSDIQGYISNPRGSGHSEIGKLLKVDVEVDTPAREFGVAIYLSPLCEYSEFAGRAFAEQLAPMFMALLFYDTVWFGAMTDAESETLTRLSGQVRFGAEREIGQFNLERFFYSDDEQL